MKAKAKKPIVNCLGAAFATLFLAFTFLCGCDSIPPTPPGPQGSSVACWSNDFQRNSNGSIWVVNATWTKDGKILFQDRRFTTDQFIQMLSSQKGITTNTPISILREPEAEQPCGEMGKFFEAGYFARPLSIPKEYWRWWRKTHAQQPAGG